MSGSKSLVVVTVTFKTGSFKTVDIKLFEESTPMWRDSVVVREKIIVFSPKTDGARATLLTDVLVAKCKSACCSESKRKINNAVLPSLGGHLTFVVC